MPMPVFPDFGALDTSRLQAVIGALLTIVLISAVLMLVVCAATWAVATAHGHHHTATRARTGVWVAAATAILAGAATGWLNWLIALGAKL